MTDILDETVADALGGSPDDPDSPSELWVCSQPAKSGDGLCGASFDTKVKLNSHSIGVHQLTWDGKPTAKGGRKPKDQDAVQPPKTDAKTEKKAADKAKVGTAPKITNENRAAVYQESLASIGLLARLGAGRWVTDYDLQVWTAGSGNLASALDGVGEQNAGIRSACDLILSGGGGGAYVQLIMALGMIGVPIAAAHGLLPPDVGQRFAAMVGVIATPTVVQGPPPTFGAGEPEREPRNRLPISEWTYDDWREVLFAAQSNTTAISVIMEQMQSAGVDPTQVVIPDMPGTEPFVMPTDEEHRGSTGTDPAAADETVPAA